MPLKLKCRYHSIFNKVLNVYHTLKLKVHVSVLSVGGQRRRFLTLKLESDVWSESAIIIRGNKDDTFSVN